MSEAIGPVAVLPADGHGPLLPGVDESSEETQRLVDSEVRTLVEGAYGEVVELLRDERARLDALADALLERETLDSADAYAAAGLPAPPRVRDALAASAAASVSSP
jgi:cell division protease FtsH